MIPRSSRDRHAGCFCEGPYSGASGAEPGRHQARTTPVGISVSETQTQSVSEPRPSTRSGCPPPGRMSPREPQPPLPHTHCKGHCPQPHPHLYCWSSSRVPLLPCSVCVLLTDSLGSLTRHPSRTPRSHHHLAVTCFSRTHRLFPPQNTNCRDGYGVVSTQPRTGRTGNLSPPTHRVSAPRRGLGRGRRCRSGRDPHDRCDPHDWCDPRDRCDGAARARVHDSGFSSFPWLKLLQFLTYV